jgi:hypothetical protein
VKVEKNEVAVAQKSSESKQNSLSYDFFKTRCSGAGMIGRKINRDNA